MKKVKTCIAVVSAIVGVVSFIVVTTVEIEGIKVGRTYVLPVYHLLLYFLSGISIIIFFYCGIYCSMRDKILRWLDKETWLDRFAIGRQIYYNRRAEIKDEKQKRLLRIERGGRRGSWGIICWPIILFVGAITPPVIKNNQYVMTFFWSKCAWSDPATTGPFLNIYWAEKVHPIFFLVYALIYLFFISWSIGGIIFGVSTMIIKKKYYKKIIIIQLDNSNYLETKKR